MLVRTDVDERSGVSVIGMFEHDHVAPPGVCAREAQRQLISLAAGVDKETDTQGLRQGRG